MTPQNPAQDVSDVLIDQILSRSFSLDGAISTYIRGDTMATGFAKADVVRAILEAARELQQAQVVGASYVIEQAQMLGYEGNDFAGAAHALAERADYFIEAGTDTAPQSSAPVVGELVDKDHARLALFKAIEAVTFGNKTDDKLILDNLRDAGFWIAKLPSESLSRHQFREATKMVSASEAGDSFDKYDMHVTDDGAVVFTHNGKTAAIYNPIAAAPAPGGGHHG